MNLARLVPSDAPVRRQTGSVPLVRASGSLGEPGPGLHGGPARKQKESV